MATPRNGPLELGYSNDGLFWFRARLEKKVTTMMTDARVSGVFTPLAGFQALCYFELLGVWCLRPSGLWWFATSQGAPVW